MLARSSSTILERGVDIKSVGPEIRVGSAIIELTLKQNFKLCTW